MILFGATSILGFSLARLFPRTILPFVTPGSRAPSLRHWPVLKLEDCAWPEALFHQHQPDFLLYCHAVCDVPKCEAAPEWAREINVEHVRRVLAALPAATRLIYVSSDHVFGGDGVYDEASSPCPISVYGRTRVEAENLVLSRQRLFGDSRRFTDRTVAKRPNRTYGLAALSNSAQLTDHHRSR